MDPDKALYSILEAMRDADEYPHEAEDFRDDIVEKLESLASWIRGGGFIPYPEYCHKDAHYRIYRKVAKGTAS